MRITRVRAIARKELIQVRRDPLSLAMAFLMPVMLLFIFGYAISLDVDRLTTIVYDRDKSSLSRDLIAGFRESGYFSILRYADGQGDIDRAIDRGEARVAVWIPEGFSENLRTGAPAPLQVIVDGSDSNTATIALAYISALSERFGRKTAGGRIEPLIESRVRVWYNDELKSRNYIIPGLIAVIMAVISALLTSLTIAREWERGTMEQLVSTPVKTHELIIGKLIPYFFIGFIDVVMSLLIVIFLFDVPFAGSVVLLLALSSVFLFGTLSFGMLISIVAKSQLVASQVAMVTTFLPAFLLSGFMFSISNMPLQLQVMTHIIPARYFVAILKSIFMKGVGLEFLALETALLTVFGLIVFTAANRKFRKVIG